jgi:methionine-R-sulfoxide reductase
MKHFYTVITLLVVSVFAGGIMNKNLSDFEKYVLFEKGTERAFSGEYYDFDANGTYRCKNCGNALFNSSAKFDSGTGWPSFDSAIKGAVKEIADSDGMRTEIVCANCGAHLGHVFKGEGFTDKNVRHCVNSASLDFESDEK